MRNFASYLSITVIGLTLVPGLSFGSAQSVPELPSPWNLEAAVNYAIERNPRIEIAVQRLESAQASTKSIQSRNLPVISIISEYAQTNNPMHSFGNILNQGAFDETIDFNDPGRTDNLLIGTEITYRLYDGGKIVSSAEAAEGLSLASSLSLDTVHQQIGYEVVRSYYTILQNREMVQVSDEAIHAINASLEVGKARYEAGDLLKEDLLNLELQQVRATEELIQAKHNLLLSEQVFWNLLGYEKSDRLPLPGISEIEKVPADIDFSGRLELKSYDYLIESAEAELKATESSNLPTIDTFARYQYDIGTVLDDSGDSWMAGIRMNYDIYDGNRTGHDSSAVRSRLLELKAEKEKLILNLSLELQQAKVLYRQSVERLEVTEKMVQVAEESAKLSRLRFQEGLILASDLIDIEMRLTDANAKQAAAKAENSIAIANLRKASGYEQFKAVE